MGKDLGLYTLQHKVDLDRFPNQIPLYIFFSFFFFFSSGNFCLFGYSNKGVNFVVLGGVIAVFVDPVAGICSEKFVENV